MTQTRREVLRGVRREFPAATVTTILQTYDSRAATVGGLLRTRLRERLGVDQAKPGRSTLFADWPEPTHTAEVRVRSDFVPVNLHADPSGLAGRDGGRMTRKPRPEPHDDGITRLLDRLAGYLTDSSWTWVRT